MVAMCVGGELREKNRQPLDGSHAHELKGVLKDAGVELTELSTHLQGQLVAAHPAYDIAFDGFAAPSVRCNPKARQEWAVNQLLFAAKASRNLGLTAHVTFSGALAWPFMYPWPQRPAGLVETPLTSWRGGGDRSSTPSTRPASISATKSIPARICMTA